MQTQPFRARRPSAGFEDTIAAPPYDVLSRTEAAAMAAGRPDSMLWTTRPEIGFSGGGEPSESSLCEAARRHYRGLVARGRLPLDPESRYYLYEQRMGSHCQRGIAALWRAEDYRRGSIRRHETTRRDKERERAALLLAVGAQPGLVFLACRDTALLKECLEADADEPWAVDFEMPDGVRHRLRPCARTDRAAAALAELRAVYIADGHHRAAAAAAAAAAREDCPAAQWFPGVVFPAGALRLFAYHRWVRSLNGMSRDDFLRALDREFTRRPAEPSAGPDPGRIRLWLADACFDLQTIRPVAAERPSDDLDVAVLQNRILRPLLGVADPRASQILDFSGGPLAIPAIARRLRSGEAAAAFLVAPVSVERMMAVADGGETLPPKSTWFEPKLLEGLLIQEREDSV